MIIQCPHCEQLTEIIELRCKIFRCGIYKKNYKQINPHLSKEKCDGLIHGKPFLIENDKNDYIVENCDDE